MAARIGGLMLVLLAALILLGGCDSGGTQADAGLVRVDITDEAGKKHSFFLEPALDNATRVQGLSDRDEIAQDGGMLFVFPTARQQSFVMRRCPIPIDIIYVDGTGRVVSRHAMLPEDPQREGESDAAYDRRLKRYPSRFAVPYVVELDGGMIEKLGIDEGDEIKIHDMKGWRDKAK